MAKRWRPRHGTGETLLRIASVYRGSSRLDWEGNNSWRERCRLIARDRNIGVDFSGAGTPECNWSELRVDAAERSGTPKPVQLPPRPRRSWTRRGLAEWLCLWENGLVGFGR